MFLDSTVTNKNFSRGAFRIALFMLVLLFPLLASAQKDSIPIIRPDTATKMTKHDSLVKIRESHAPRTAAILSACLPGAGQVYNGGTKWMWKVPIIYAGLLGCGYALRLNQDSINHLNVGIRERVDDTLPSWSAYAHYPGYSTDQLVTIKQYYQRYRDLSILGLTFIYALQIVDATVDAHLKTFDVSDNLSMRVHPRLLMSPTGSIYSTCSVSLFFH